MGEDKTPSQKNSTITRAQLAVIDAAARIMTDAPGDDDRAYMARQLVQATLPHSNPGDVPVWTRKNGKLTLVIQPGWNAKAGKSLGYPYGTVPRLLLFWITAEAVRNKTRRIELGRNLTDFMLQLGLNPNNGGAGAKRSDARRLREQAERLFRAKLSFQMDEESDGREGVSWIDMAVAPKGQMWWNPRDPDQATLWGSWIELGEDFYEAIVSAPVPVDVRALKALKKSPLALDLYAWLTYEAFRASRKRQSRFVSWGLLMKQLGTDYAGEADFRRKTKAALNKICVVYPGLRLGKRMGGIEVLPTSLTAIQPAPVIDGAASR